MLSVAGCMHACMSSWHRWTTRYISIRSFTIRRGTSDVEVAGERDRGWFVSGMDYIIKSLG